MLCQRILCVLWKRGCAASWRRACLAGRAVSSGCGLVGYKKGDMTMLARGVRDVPGRLGRWQAVPCAGGAGCGWPEHVRTRLEERDAPERMDGAVATAVQRGERGGPGASARQQPQSSKAVLPVVRELARIWSLRAVARRSVRAGASAVGQQMCVCGQKRDTPERTDRAARACTYLVVESRVKVIRARSGRVLRA